MDPNIQARLDSCRQLPAQEVSRRLGPGWDAAWANASGDESATSVLEAGALWAAVMDAAPGGWVVELGCWKCRTAIVIGHAIAWRGHDLRAVTVDPLVPYAEPALGFTANPPSPEWVREKLARSGAGHVELIPSTSAAASIRWDRGPVSVLWVDGAHDDRAIRIDWAGWAPHLAPDAIVVFHDTAIPWIGDLTDELVDIGELHDPRAAGIGTVFARRPGRPMGTVDHLLG